MTMKSGYRLVHIIVAHGESAADLDRLFASIEREYETAAPPEIDWAVQVVCNDVTAKTARLAETFARRPYALGRLHTPCTIGYGPAINLARKGLEVEPEWLIVGNADLVWPAGSIAVLGRLLASVEPSVACVAPLVLDAPEVGGGVQPSVGRFPTLVSLLLGRLRSRTSRKYTDTANRGDDIDWATGACLAIRLSAFDAVGGFDEAIFLDYEETDLCRRFADAGWRRRIEPAWEVIHTSPHAQRPADPDRHQHTRASLVRYVAKHRPAWELHTLGALMRLTMMCRSARHPFAPGWRAGVEAYCELRGRQVH